MTENNKGKEVDLFDLFASIGRGIRNLVINVYDMAMWCLFFAVKRWKFLLIFVVLGLAYGTYSVVNSKQQYTSGMLIRSNAVSSFDMKLILDELNNYFISSNESSTIKLQGLLQMDSAELSNVNGISTHFVIDVNQDGSLDYYDLKDQADPKDTILSRSTKYLYITAKIVEPTVLPELEKGLVNYISSQELIKVANGKRLDKYTQRVNAYALEFDYLDSLQKVVYFEKTKPEIKYGQNQLMLGESRKQLVHNDKLSILYSMEGASDEISLYKDPVTVINGFPLAARRVETPIISIIKTIIKLVFLGYVIALLAYFLRKVSGKYMAKID